MNSTTTQIEAASDLDVPPRIWDALVDGARRIADRLWPGGSVSLRIVNTGTIRSLNRRYRLADEVTDVLSFPAEDARLHGDIAVCWDQVLQQAETNGNTTGAEALALVCHGMLHLAGYTHETDATEAEMNRLTIELCKSAGVEVRTFGH